MANIDIKVGYTIDKTGLNEIKRQLTDLKLEAAQAKISGNLTKELEGASKAASQLEDILNSAWNTKLNQLDLSKVNTGIKDTFKDVQNLKTALTQSGNSGVTAYNNFASAILNTNIGLKQTSATLDKMAVTFKNTVRFGISSSIFNSLSSSIQKAYDYTVKLDTSLNDIRIVTGKSADEMDRFAVRANQVAKDLGRSTKDFTEAALIYYQQGLGNEESQARAEVTMKAANVTGQSGRDVSEQLTAIWNGYKVSAEESETYIDKVAAVAAATAADLEELATGMGKVASAANIMGVDIDQLNAQLATVVSVTRQAPESVGTAFKTIYARMGDIEAGLDDEVTLGSYTQKMAEFGVNVLDANGKLRDMGEVIEEIGNKWTDMSREQQIALSQTMAGTRQYNNLLSLFDNWDMYTDALETSKNSFGELQKEQDIYMESTKAHLRSLETELERTYATLFDKNAANTLIDALAGFINQFNDFIEGLGGGLNALGNIALQVANIFNKQIGSSIERQIENLELWKRNRDSLTMKSKIIESQNYSSDQTQDEVMRSHLAKGENISSGALDKEAGIAERLLNVRKALTAEEYKELTALQQQIGLEQTQLDKITQYNNAYKESASTLQNNKEYYEEELIQQEKLLTYLELGTESQAQQGNQVAIINAIMEDIVSENSEMSEILAGMGDEQERVLNLVQNEVLDADQITELIEKQKQLIEEQKIKIQETADAVQAKQAFEDGTNVKLQEQIDKKEQIIAATEKQAQRELSIQKVISITTGLMEAASSIIGGLSVAFDKSSTSSEKLNGYWAAGLGTLSSVANILLPGSGVIVQGIGTITKSVLEMTGVWEDWEDSLKSSKERLEELKNTMEDLKKSQKEALSQYDDTSNAIDYFKEIQDRFVTLQNLAEKGLLTSDLRKEYNEYLAKVQTYNDEALISYDNQGKKIAQNASLIESTIKKLEKENKLLLQDTYNNKNWGTLSDTFQKQYKEIYNNDTINAMGADAYLSLAGTGVNKYLNNNQMTDLEQYFSSDNILKYSQNIAKFRKDINKALSPLIDSVAEELQAGISGGDAYTTWYQLQNYLDKYEKELRKFSKKFEDIRLNSDDFLNYLKYNKKDSKNYNKLTELGIENLDSILTSYIDGLNIGLQQFQDKEGNLDAGKVKNHLKNIEKNLVDLFTGASGQDLLDIYKEAMEVKVEELSSQAYEEALIDSIENFLSKIDSEETFKKVEELLPQIFGVEQVNARWSNGKAQLEKGKNIVTQGEQIARDTGRRIAEQTIQNQSAFSKDDQKTVSSAIEQYLQKGLTEADLKKLDTEKLGTDFNNLLFNAIKNGSYGSEIGIEGILQNALDRQGMDSSYQEMSSAIAKRSSDIKKFDLDEEELRNYSKHLMDVADESDDLSESLQGNADAAVAVAQSTMRMNRGVESLADNFENWNDILRTSSKSSQEYCDALDGVRNAIADVLDVEEDLVSDNFIEQHLDNIAAAAEGNAEAIELLRDAYADDLVLRIATENDVTPQVQEQISSLVDDIQTMIPDIVVGTTIEADDGQFDDFFDKCTQIINAAQMTEEQANAFFDAIGFDAQVVTDYKSQKTKEPVTETTEIVDWKPDEITYDDGEKSVRRTAMAKHTLTSTKTVGYTESETVVPIVAMATNGKTPQIQSLTKKSTGSMNNFSSSNRGGGSAGGGGGRGSGGSGSSGGGSAKEPARMDPLEKERDRYHDVDIELKQIQTDMSKLEKQKKKLFGADLIKNLNKQLDLLDKQIDKNNEKIRIAQDETNELRNKLSGKGVSFNADGTIANYASAYASQLNYVNGLIAQYNSMSAEAQEGFKDTVENAKKSFDDFVKDMNRYDEVVTDLIPGLEADIQEALDAKIDIQIEKFDMEIEIRLDLTEAERDWNDFKKKVIDDIEDDDILGNAMAKLTDLSSYYKEDNNGIIQSLRKQVDNTLAELNQMDTNGWSNVYGDNRTAALDDLKKYYEELMSNLKDVLDLQKEIHESYMDMMDEAQDKFDEQIEAYEMISDLIDHDMQVISLVYGEESYGQLAKYYDKQQQNFNSQLDFQRQQVDFWRQQLDALEEGSDEWENAKEKWSDAVEELNDLIETSIENLQDKYLNAINLIFQNLNNKVTDGLGLDYIEEEWNLINQNADQYLDTINSLYEVQKLENDYLKALDDVDSLSMRRQLKDIMEEELADLRERDKLTQYDIDRANKRYEIALKQIALQEAQQNKTKLRLRRDSQGNYRYEYTSDEDQVGQLQEELNDMYNSLYNFDKARYQENLNQIYSVWAEFQEKMAEAAQINDPVARSERELLLQTQYEQLINGLTEQNATVRENLQESAFDDLARLYDENVKNFQDMSDEEKNVLLGDLIPYWETGVQHMVDSFAGEDGFLGVCKDAFEQLHEATKNYEEGLSEIEDSGHTSFENVADGIDENIDRANQLIQNNDELINSYEEEMIAIGNVVKELDGLIEKYEEARKAAVAATEAAYNYWSEEQREAANAASSNSGAQNISPSSNSTSSGSGGDGQLSVGEAATFSGKYYSDSYGAEPSGGLYSGVAKGVIVDRITDNPYGIHIYSADGKYGSLGWIRKSQLSGYETGGYTGVWGSEGRLAMLHQKELVLNKDDTANMLNAVTILRNITNSLGETLLNKLAMSTSINPMLEPGKDILEQNVHIDAQFPNVRNSKEIEEALNNLVNMASMRANKSN